MRKAIIIYHNEKPIQVCDVRNFTSLKDIENFAVICRRNLNELLAEKDLENQRLNERIDRCENAIKESASLIARLYIELMIDRGECNEISEEQFNAVPCEGLPLKYYDIKEKITNELIPPHEPVETPQGDNDNE